MDSKISKRDTGADQPSLSAIYQGVLVLPLELVLSLQDQALEPTL